MTVKSDRIECLVQASADCPRRTNAALMAVLLAQRPQLAHHACVNGVGPTFAAVMNDTPLVHVVEHLAIDLQVQSAADAQALYVGDSQWLDAAAGVGCIRVSFTDDLQALAALTSALALLNEALALS